MIPWNRVGKRKDWAMRCVVFFVTVGLGFFVWAAWSSNTLADMGAIVPISGVFLEETVQRAIIAHDGFEQILILSTGLQTAQPVPVVRIIPFPAPPRIFEVDDDIFQTLQEIAEHHQLRYLVYFRGEIQEEPVTITDSLSIGAHSITVVKAQDAATLLDWTIDFLEGHGLPGFIPDPGRFEQVVDHYLSRDIPYFVFDLVLMEDSGEEVQPVGYAFESSHLFYPVVISSLFDDFGHIELFILSNQSAVFSGLQSHWPSWSFGGMSTTAVLERRELAELHPELANLFGKRAILGAFSHPDFSIFRDDLYFPVNMWEVKPRPSTLSWEDNGSPRELPDTLREDLSNALKEHQP